MLHEFAVAIWTNASLEKRALIMSEIEELSTLLKIDVVFIDDKIEGELIKAINMEGVVIYERYK